MKKSIFLFLCFCLFPVPTWALFGSSDGLNMYKKLDSGLEEYSQKLIYQELKGNKDDDTITSSINKQLLLQGIGECLSDTVTLTQDDVIKIVNGQVKILHDFIAESCKDPSGNVTIKKIADMQAAISKYYQTAVETSDKKISHIQKIGNIGLYSDGILENSGFDLITDLEEIDTIIFASKNEYEGTDYQDISKQLDNIISKNKKNSDNSESPVALSGDDTVFIPAASIDNNLDTISIGDSAENSITHKYTCPVGENHFLNFLTSQENKASQNNKNTDLFNGEYTALRGSDAYLNGNIGSLDDLDTITFGKYQTVNDNSSWPCNGFFCIVTDFVTYNHSLLGGADNITLEYLVSRSNNHLKKFTHTALTPTTMTVNNFELGFKDLNLPDLFNVGIQIQYKPIPILDIDTSTSEDKEEKQSGSEFSLTNQIAAYYGDLGLDYKRINDIQIYQNQEAEAKSLQYAAGGVVTKAEELINEFQSIQNINARKMGIRDDLIQSQAQGALIGQFNNQLTEIYSFTQQIQNYSEKLLILAKKLKQIPTDTN